MKKLISELETALNSDAVQWCNHEYSDGFKSALQIVRAHNPWHEVGELPDESIDSGGSYIDYIVKEYAVSEKEYYYHMAWFVNGEWVQSGSDRIMRENITHWAYLPEVKP